VNEKFNLDPTANAEMRVPEDADWLVSWFPYVMPVFLSKIVRMD
jgi:hypothetical protein